MPISQTISSRSGQIVSVNISTEKGTSKTPVPEIVVNDLGVAGDAHAGPWHRQVSLLAVESIDRFAGTAGQAFSYGDFAENLTTRGLDLLAAALLDRFQIGDVELEVTQRGKKCHGDGCAIYQQVGKCVMPKEGIFCRVIRGGVIRPDAEIVWCPRPLRFQVITLSDRASRGEYEDRSGPRVTECLERFLGNTPWHGQIQSLVLPDDAGALTTALTVARDTGVDVVITTGGTGIGPRDITPDVILSLADKVVPGVMDQVRIKYGNDKPNALLSRSVMAVLGATLVYALPGSVRAVEEYMTEILKTLEHALAMLHGLDAH